MATKTWLITGSSRGFGRAWMKAALERGDNVAGAARTVPAMDELVSEHGDRALALELNVRDRAACFEAVKRAHEHFGRLDVIVNNAGYGQSGMVEEITEQDARDQFDTNFFGPMWVTQAALPFLREQRSGHIVQVSSVGGILSFPGLGMYSSSKWAIEGLTQALSEEVSHFGIHVTLIEPGGFDTTMGDARQADPWPAYEEVHEMSRQRAAGRRAVLGSPDASAQSLFEIVDAENPPLRVFFGGAWLAATETEYARRLETWREWQPVSARAAGIDDAAVRT
jgi:NAD(P)-dependent dehydrogenase (short-subunit alcohol dehydrogenase family)